MKGFITFSSSGSSYAVYICHHAVFYLFIGFVGYSVDMEISYNTCKLDKISGYQNKIKKLL